jgi:hypothetical protein
VPLTCPPNNLSPHPRIGVNDQADQLVGVPAMRGGAAVAASVASVAVASVALAAAWATHSTHSIISSARMEVEASLYYGLDEVISPLPVALVEGR